MSRPETVELVGPEGRRKIVNAGSEREKELRAEGWKDAPNPKAVTKSKPAEESAGEDGQAEDPRPSRRGRRS